MKCQKHFHRAFFVFKSEGIMITVNEILNLTLFKKFKILTGKEYLSNTVTTTVILEYESSRINYAGYCYGYFVLVSYFFAATNPDLVNGSLRNLIQKHVSGIALKILPNEQLPDDIVKLAEENHVPILTFYEEFMEDLIICINESMKTRAQYVIHEEKLNSIMNENKDADEVVRIAHEINPEFKKKVISANLISREPASNLQVHTYFDNLMYHSAKMAKENPFTFIKNGYNVILVCSFSDEEAKELHALAYIKDILSQNGFVSDAFFIGYDAEPVDLGDLKESVYKAKIAASICQFKNLDSLSYTYVGVYKYAIALIQNDIMQKEIKEKISVLEDYDKKHEANLIKTLNSFVKNNGDYISTSKECYQHTNTIRYRVKKAEQLLDLEETTATEEITILMRCYHLLKAKIQ